MIDKELPSAFGLIGIAESHIINGTPSHFPLQDLLIVLVEYEKMRLANIQASEDEPLVSNDPR